MTINLKACVFLLLVSSAIGASAQGLDRQSINCSGVFYSGAAGQSSYSIGQAVAGFFVSSNGQLLQGFQQPDGAKGVGLSTLESYGLSATLFPNPTSANATLRITMPSKLNLQLHLTDALGRSIYSQEIAGLQGIVNQELPTSALPSGMYLLSITTTDQRALQTIKIIKAQ